MSASSPDLPAAIARLAADHGLDLDEGSIALNEMGLDFRVATAHTPAGDEWVLRIPRRPDVAEHADVEGRLLRLVAPHLTAAVPNWRIQTRELIAYPLLPGRPGLELDAGGEPVWHADVSSTEYATSLGDLLAELHGIDPGTARATGIEAYTPAESRDRWRADIERVAAHFEVARDLLERWHAWLDDDGYWPDHSVLTHGEVYAGHTLVVGNRICAVLDWTTASIGDPARDFTFHRASASPAAFDLTVSRYVERGGRVGPRFAEHCTEMFSASAVAYGIYALTTGEAAHRDAAAAQLNPADG